VLKVDVQGAETIRRKVPGSDHHSSRQPLLHESSSPVSRNGAPYPAELEMRLSNAREELTHVSKYDYVVINEAGRLHEAADKVKAIIVAEKCRSILDPWSCDLR